MMRPVKQRSPDLKQSVSLKELCYDFFTLTQTFKKSPSSICRQNADKKDLKIAVVGRPFRVHRNKTVHSAKIGKEQIKSLMDSNNFSKVKMSPRKRKKDLGLEKIINFEKLLQLTEKSPSFEKQTKPRKSKLRKDQELKELKKESGREKKVENMNKYNVLTAKSKSINYRSVNLNKTGYNSRQQQKTSIYGRETLKAKLTKSLCFGSILGGQEELTPWNEEQKYVELDQKQFL